jgi:hypothetical protein
MLYEVRIVKPVGHVQSGSSSPAIYRSTRARDLFFVVRRVREAQEDYDGVVDVRWMARTGETGVTRLGHAD